jgi:hypothetical protein
MTSARSGRDTATVPVAPPPADAADMTSPTSVARTASTRPLVRHLVEMIAAMLAGMVLLTPLWPYAIADDLLGRADVAAATMATSMTTAMTVWMIHRGHRAAAIAEMAAAMGLAFLVFLIPWWAGLVTAQTALIGGHLLMLPAMLIAIRRRAAEYTGPRIPPVRSGRWQPVLNRWPTAVALLVTADNIIDPRPVPALTLLVLPVGYLVIGAVRRTLRPRRLLLAQLGGLAAYVLLLVVATASSGDAALGLIGAGWLAHAGWDAWHHHHDVVVPRGYAEWCGVVDAVIGVSVLVVALA